MHHNSMPPHTRPARTPTSAATAPEAPLGGSSPWTASRPGARVATHGCPVHDIACAVHSDSDVSPQEATCGRRASNLGNTWLNTPSAPESDGTADGGSEGPELPCRRSCVSGGFAWCRSDGTSELGCGWTLAASDDVDDNWGQRGPWGGSTVEAAQAMGSAQAMSAQVVASADLIGTGIAWRPCSGLYSRMALLIPFRHDEGAQASRGESLRLKHASLWNSEPRAPIPDRLDC